MKKDNNEIKNADIISNVIVLRSVYGKTNKYYIQPCRDPKTGRFPACVKRVDSNGDMILNDKERQEDGITRHFIPETAVFIIEDGKSFDLNDIFQKAEWEAIEHCLLIAPSRTARDAKGNLIIDGTTDPKSANPRYGIAELYIDRPGLITQDRVSKKKKLHNAIGHIINDERGYEGRLLKARLLGRDMKNAPDSDIEDFLISRAEKNPDEIIALYTGDDLQLRLLFLDAKDKHIITYKNKAFYFGENLLAATDESVITWMKQSRNAKTLEILRKEVYPEFEN